MRLPQRQDFPARACPLWSGWDMKEQSQLWQGKIPGGGKALCSPASRAIPRVAVWTTRLIEPGEKQSKVTILSLVAQTQAHQILWPVPQVVTLEGSRTAAPAAYRSWAALPWSPLGRLMATVNLNNKKWLRSLIFYFSKWRILVVWIEAYDQLCTILRGAHKQPAMLWLKSSSWYPAVRVALLNCQTGLWEEHQISHT